MGLWYTRGVETKSYVSRRKDGGIIDTTFITVRKRKPTRLNTLVGGFLGISDASITEIRIRIPSTELLDTKLPHLLDIVGLSHKDMENR